MRYCYVFDNRNLNKIKISIINMPGFFVQGSGLDRTSTFATAIITPLKRGRQNGKAFFTSIYWLTRIDKPAKLLWFSPQLISSRVPEPLPSNNQLSSLIEQNTSAIATGYSLSLLVEQNTSAIATGYTLNSLVEQNTSPIATGYPY